MDAHERCPRSLVANTSNYPSLVAEVPELIDLLLSHRGYHRPGGDLRECSNLAPAGTGTTSLTALLQPHSAHTHHIHLITPAVPRTLAVDCFVMTLRDPADRLVTAFNYQKAVGLTFPENALRPADPSEWLRAIRDDASGSSLHRAALHSYRQSLPGDMKEWLFCPNHQSGRQCDHLTGGGSPFLVPQIYYLLPLLRRGVALGAQSSYSNVAAKPLSAKETKRLTIRAGEWAMGRNGTLARPAEVHFVCVNRYESDWQRFVRAVGPAKGGGVSTQHVRKAKSHEGASSEVHLNHREGPKTATRFSLGEDDRAYVRECLYPLDAKLYQAMCA